MQDATAVWARVTIQPDMRVLNYSLFSNESLPSGDITSSQIGHVWCTPPVPPSRLPPNISNPLLLIIMNGNSIANIGGFLRSPHPAATEHVVWLYNVTFTYNDLTTLMESEPWKTSTPHLGKQIAAELLARLRPLSVIESTKDSHSTMSCSV